MSNIIVEQPDGEVHEVTLRTLFGWLADPDGHVQLLIRLNKGGRHKVALLKGEAFVQRAPTTLPKPQRALPLNEFSARVRLQFSLPATIHVAANNGAEARHLIEETVRGSIGIPPGFKIEILGEDMEALVNQMDIGDLNAIEEIEILHIEPRLLLDHTPLTRESLT